MCRAIEEEIFAKKPSLNLLPHKIINAEELPDFANAIKNYRSVFTNGCFDILHPGHVYVLKKAAELGEILIVGLNSDDSVKRLKGDSRPYHCFNDRAGVLAALEVVDYVIEFGEDTPAELIKALQPKVLVKGGDYQVNTIVGADQVLAEGGEVKVIPLLEGHSTTGILNNNEQ
jgi:D-beta-D-heptose 7-phosphate kinase/D-beta-D-heptose 1-phosphate adenosyltransferase